MQEAHPTFPNKLEAFVLVGLLIGFEIVAAFAIRDADLLRNVEWQGVGGFTTVVGNGFLFILVMTFKRLSYRSLFHSTSNSVTGTIGSLALPILMIVPGVVLLTGVLNLFVQAIWPMSHDEADAFSDMVRIDIIPVLFGCLLAPLLEEMLFRGIIVRSFLQQYSRKQTFLWSALIFGLAHMNAYQFVTAFVLGLVLSWLYERTRSLWPSILMHAAFNSFVAWGASDSVESGSSLVWFLGLAFVGTIVGGILLIRMLEPTVQKQESE